jgi:hypothetical protein
MYDAHLRVIKYLVRDCGCQLDSQLFAMAVHHGELKTARWMLRQNRAFKYRPSVPDAAAASGNTALVDWLKEEEGVVFTATAMAYGAVHSSISKLATVQMLRNRRVPWSEEVFCYQRQQLSGACRVLAESRVSTSDRLVSVHRTSCEESLH